MPISTVHTSYRCHQRNAATDQHQTKLTSFDDYHQQINNRQDVAVVEAEVEEDDGGEYYLDDHHYHRHQPARAFGNGGCGFPILHDCVDVNLLQEGDDDVHHNNVAQQEECTASSSCPPSPAHEDERAVEPPFPLQPRGTANCNTKVVHDDQKMFSWADDDEAWLDSLIKEVNNQEEEQEEEDEDDSDVEEDPTTQAFGDECHQNQHTQDTHQINVTGMNRSGRSCTPDDCNDDPQDGHCSPPHVAVTEHKPRHRQQPSRHTDAHPREVTLEELLGLDACVTIAETACQVYYHHKRRVKKYFEIGDTDDDAEEVSQEAKTAEKIWFEEACKAGKNGQRASSTTTQPKQLKNRASSGTTTKFVIGKTNINNQNSSPASLKESNDDPTIPGGLRLNRTLSRLSNTSTVVHRTVDLYIQWHADRNLLNITRPYLHIPSNCIALIAASVALKRQFSFGFPTFEDFIEKLTPQFPSVFANFHDHVKPFEVQSIETLIAFYCDCSRPTAADILLSSLRNLFTREQLACLSAQDSTSCAGDPQHGCHPAFSSGGVHQLSELLHPSNVKGDPHHPQHRLHQLSVDTFLSLRRQAKVVLSHPFVYKELIATARDATTAAAVPVEKWAVAVLRATVAHCCPPPAPCVVEHCAQHNVLRTAKKGLPPQRRTSDIAAHQPRRSQPQVLRHEDYEELIPVGVSNPTFNAFEQCHGDDHNNGSIHVSGVISDGYAHFGWRNAATSAGFSAPPNHLPHQKPQDKNGPFVRDGVGI